MGSKLRCGHERKVLPDVLPENGEQIVVNGCREQLYPTALLQASWVADQVRRVVKRYFRKWFCEQSLVCPWHGCLMRTIEAQN